MDRETAFELIADRYGTVMWELVVEARDWLIENGYKEELRAFLRQEAEREVACQ